MKEALSILKVIKNMPSFKPEPGIGICFGTVVTVLYQLFAGNLAECDRAIKKTAQTFEELVDEKDIQEKIDQISNDPEIMGLVSSIAFAQRSKKFTGVYLEEHSDLDYQTTSIKKMFDFFYAGSPRKRYTYLNHTMKNDSSEKIAKIGDSFTVLLTQNIIHDLITNINQNGQRYPVGFLVAISGHVFGFGFDPISSQWFHTNDFAKKIIDYADSDEKIMKLILKSLEWNKTHYNAATIFPITHPMDHASRRTIENFAQTENLKIKNYTNDQIQFLAIRAYLTLSEKTIQKMVDCQRLDPALSSYENIIKLSYIKKDVLSYCIHYELNDMFNFIMCFGPDNVLNELDEDGETPLTLSIKTRAHDFTSKLIDHDKVNINKPNKYGMTPVQCAEKYQQSEHKQHLIEKGADVFVKSNRPSPT